MKMALLPKVSISSNINNRLNIFGQLQLVISKSTQIDVIDAFTKNLITNKSLKWQMFYYTKLNTKQKLLPKSSTDDGDNSSNIKIQSKSELVKFTRQRLLKEEPKQQSFSINYNKLEKLQEFPSISSRTSTHQLDSKTINVRTLDTKQLNELLHSFIHQQNSQLELEYILMECIRYKLLPSYEILELALKESSLKGDTKNLERIIELCRNFSDSWEWLSTRIASFESVSLWKHGKIENALDTLVNGYTKLSIKSKYQPQSQKELELLHWSFNEIIKDTFLNKSEAILIQLIKIGNSIYDRFSDIYVISWIWKQCFISDWYSDQKLAMEIFEKNEQLRNLVCERSSSLSFTLLRDNFIDSVYRLIELYLRFDRQDACKECLNQLFLYHYWRKDFRACSEIIKTSKELKMKLDEQHSDKLFNLILDRSKGKYIVNTPTIKRFKYKF